MPVLTAHAVTKAYGLKPLFENATFTIKRGEKVALLGPNGTGKSTLLRVLAGLEPLDTGSIDRRRDASILYLPQEPALDPERTPREIAREGLALWHAAKLRYDEVSHRIGEGETTDELMHEQAALAEDVERLGGWSRDHEVDEILLHLGVTDVERPVGTMSGGERRRVALARILVAKPDLAIFDEPTNHLDADTIAWLEEYLVREFPGAVLLVTHDRYLLDHVASRVLDLEYGQVAEYTKRNDHVGAFEDFLEQKAERYAHAERVESNRQNFLRKEIEWLRRGPKARSTKQKARIQRAETAINAEGLRVRGEVELVGLEDGSSRLGGTILEVVNVGLELGGRRLIDDLSLRLVKGNRIGIVGPNGAGKTTLLKLVTGELTPTNGKVVRGVQTKFAYFDQARTTLKDDWTVLDNVAEREHSDKVGAGEVTIGDRVMGMRAYLELFLFEGAALRRKVSALSGGERARVALALALKTGANVLLLDEPTNDLDIATLGSLAELIESWPGCVLVVSHDRFFLDRVVTSILAFEGDGKVQLYAGNWESYSEQKREDEKAQKLATRMASSPPPRSTPPKAASVPPPAKAAVAQPASGDRPAGGGVRRKPTRKRGES
jgi:ATP-binding cassette subfamily F protein uup